MKYREDVNALIEELELLTDKFPKYAKPLYVGEVKDAPDFEKHKKDYVFFLVGKVRGELVWFINSYVFAFALAKLCHDNNLVVSQEEQEIIMNKFMMETKLLIQGYAEKNDIELNENWFKNNCNPVVVEPKKADPFLYGLPECQMIREIKITSKYYFE